MLFRSQVQTTDQSLGGNDIVNAGNGDNTILLGPGSDQLISGNGADIVIGDNGIVVFENGGFASGDAVSIVSTDLTDSTTGNDIISTGSGSDSIIAGGGSDTVNSGTGNDAVLGDHGTMTYTTSGVLTEIDTTLVTLGSGDNITGEIGRAHV